MNLKLTKQALRVDGRLVAYHSGTWPVARWGNFSFDEIKCKHTGLCYVLPTIMDDLQRLRTLLDMPLPITSGYRHPTHPAEAQKEAGPGTHAQGLAFDIGISSPAVWGFLKAAMAMGFSGIGIKQHGLHSERFVHIDKGQKNRPAIWTY